MHEDAPFARPAGFALLAALLFGVVAPLVHRFGAGVGPFATATLLYAGASIAALDPGGRRANGGLRLGRRELPRVALVALLGAALAPAALAWGIARTSGATASLLLNLEAVFTVVLGRVLLHEQLGARAWAGVAAIVAGGVVLALPDSSRGASLVGALAVAAATLAWALDNVLTRPLADFPPTHVVGAKATLGATLSLGLALVRREAFPSVRDAAALLLVGALGFGVSLRLYLRAQRDLGAARTGSLFAIGPFLGMVLAVALGDRPAWLGLAAAAALMLVGIVLHLGEKHGHAHTHPAVEHEHAHRHDDGHHDHTHDSMPQGEHAHRHRHGYVAHDHPHSEDAHHRHEH